MGAALTFSKDSQKAQTCVRQRRSLTASTAPIRTRFWLSLENVSDAAQRMLEALGTFDLIDLGVRDFVLTRDRLILRHADDENWRFHCTICHHINSERIKQS